MACDLGSLWHTTRWAHKVKLKCKTVQCHIINMTDCLNLIGILTFTHCFAELS